MEQRSLRVIQTDKTFFSKITNTINKLLIPTKLSFNNIIISIKRNNLLKLYENYIEANNKDNTAKKEVIAKKYEDAYALYLESIDKFIMESIYKKVRNGNASEFEKNALTSYYEVTHLKDTEYTEYKYKKQKYLINLDYQTIKILEKDKLTNKYEEFYVYKMDSLYKGLLKHYSIQLSDNIIEKDKQRVYEKIFLALEEYITIILPIKMKKDSTDTYKEILEQYEKLDRFTVGKLDQIEFIEKKMLLLGISRQLFTHSLPLIAAELCYIKLLKDTRSLIVDTRVKAKKNAAYELLIELIEAYSIKLLSTKIYWDKPEKREEYKKFWNEYKNIEKIKEEQQDEYNIKREILFIRNDLKILNYSPNNYDKIIKIYKQKLVAYGVMRQFKNHYKHIDAKLSKKKINKI